MWEIPILEINVVAILIDTEYNLHDDKPLFGRVAQSLSAATAQKGQPLGSPSASHIHSFID